MKERRIVAAIKAFIKDVISDAGKLLALAICPLGIFVYMTIFKRLLWRCMGFLSCAEGVEDAEAVSCYRSTY